MRDRCRTSDFANYDFSGVSPGNAFFIMSTVDVIGSLGLCAAIPPLRPAALASSLVHSWPVPF